MSRSISWTKVLEVFLVMTFLVGGLTAVSAQRLHAAPKVQAEAQEGKVNVNTAGPEELVEVRGIGPTLAERIVEFRKSNGPFKSVEDLAAVRGIGSAKLERIKGQISV